MSTLNVESISHPTSGSNVTINGITPASTGSLGLRNLIINGAMQVAQRGTSLSLAHDGTTNGYLTDRFRVALSGTDQYDCTVTQSTDAPEGFASSLLITTGTAETTVDAAEYGSIQHRIEAQNMQLLSSGTSDAKTTTLSFWVKSSQTGTYVVSIYKNDSTARGITATYAISTADTWEYKTLTFAGDTDSSGGIDNDNGLGWIVSWVLGAGSDYTSTDSTSWIDYVNAGFAYGQTTNGVLTTANATFAITGVQLEVGSVATPFEHRSYGDELARCQRYFYKWERENGQGQLGQVQVYSGTQAWGRLLVFPVRMRTSPTFSSNGTFRFFNHTLSTGHDVTWSTTYTGPTQFGAAISGGSSLTAGHCSGVYANADGDYLHFDAEL